METRSGGMVSIQVAVFGDIDAKALTQDNFKLQQGGAFVETAFDTGWNPELIREIKATSLANLKIKYGY